MNAQNPFSPENRKQRLQSPDQIGSTLQVTALPTYLLALTALLLLGAFFVWGFLGSVSDKVYYSGVVFPAEGTTDVSLPNRGMVRTLFVRSGDKVTEGQTVARLSQTVLLDRINRNKAELEKAEYQYQAILMGQGYKRNELEQAPEDIKRQARINSGYNTAKASLQQLEHELTYCTITAPVSGAVSRIDATLYSAATPGVPLFYIVDTDHLKVCFDVLENELRKFQTGTRIQIISIAYPTETHEAVVSAISPVVEKNGMVHLEATLPPHPHLMPGMTAIVTCL